MNTKKKNLSNIIIIIKQRYLLVIFIYNQLSVKVEKCAFKNYRVLNTHPYVDYDIYFEISPNESITKFEVEFKQNETACM